MRRLHLALPTLLITVCGCELVKNTGQACVVATDLACTCEGYYGDTGDGGDGACPSSPIPWDWEGASLPLEDWADCAGRYPANTAFTLEAMLYTGGNGYGVKEKCSVEVEGKRLIAEAQFWHEPDRDAIKEAAVIVRCDVPPLAPGIWTLEFGGNETQFEVGTDEIQDLACVSSKSQHDGYD